MPSTWYKYQMAKIPDTERSAPRSLKEDMENLPPADLRDFLAFVEAKGHKTWDPLTKEGLDMQALYIQECSQHPVDVLTRIMTNTYCTPSERMTAAKTLMEYSMRKVPSNVEVLSTTQAIKIDASALANLSTEELDTLQALLAKAAPQPTNVI